ncbi:peptidase M20 [Anopheles sinensis]|uniref:Peptidase M20 n=1 Tax=Anopheles sinensis TaxID=74873 RepID=A0A084WL64_ANOSI|nr:peptidase M20 [Anopheles sinensis]
MAMKVVILKQSVSPFGRPGDELRYEAGGCVRRLCCTGRPGAVHNHVPPRTSEPDQNPPDVPTGRACPPIIDMNSTITISPARRKNENHRRYLITRTTLRSMHSVGLLPPPSPPPEANALHPVACFSFLFHSGGFGCLSQNVVHCSLALGKNSLVPDFHPKPRGRTVPDKNFTITSVHLLQLSSTLQGGWAAWVENTEPYRFSNSRNE